MPRKPHRNIPTRLPIDVHAWLAAQAERNATSINSEIVRAVRNEMDRENLRERRVARELNCTRGMTRDAQT